MRLGADCCKKECMAMYKKGSMYYVILVEGRWSSMAIVK